MLGESAGHGTCWDCREHVGKHCYKCSTAQATLPIGRPTDNKRLFRLLFETEAVDTKFISRTFKEDQGGGWGPHLPKIAAVPSKDLDLEGTFAFFSLNLTVGVSFHSPLNTAQMCMSVQLPTNGNIINKIKSSNNGGNGSVCCYVWLLPCTMMFLTLSSTGHVCVSVLLHLAF